MKELLCISVFCLLATHGVSLGAQRPNMIVVMADDMGFSDLGCYGGEIRTPTIDRLATEGIRFSHFSNFSFCGPSRASLMTGCYPWEVGQKPGTSIFRNLNKNCATLPELLKSNGYTTCAVGRLDMVIGNDWHDPTDIAQSLDSFLGSASGGPGNYFKEVKGTPWFKDGKRYDRPEGIYSTDLITDHVVKFIEKQHDQKKPFFIYVSHYAPHWPLQAKAEDIAPYMELYKDKSFKTLMNDRLAKLIGSGLVPKGTELPTTSLNPKQDLASRELPVERLAIHAAMVESIDRSLAKTIEALKKVDQADNTLIFILSDNGGTEKMSLNRKVPKGARPGDGNTFLNQGAAIASLNNVPFRDYKRSFYEGGIASPFIAWWPNGLKNTARISHSPCHIGDIMPTCLELAGANYPESFNGRKLIPLAGRSMLPILQDKEVTDERVMIWPQAVREGSWKLIIRNKTVELYNLDSDRNESNNLAAKYPERVEKMRALHQTHYPH